MSARIFRATCWLWGAASLQCAQPAALQLQEQPRAPQIFEVPPTASNADDEESAPAPEARPTKRSEEADTRVRFEARTFALALDGLPSPLVAVPDGSKAPLIVAAHGAGGSPEWQCPWLQALAPGVSMLLACLRGKPMLPYEGAFYYPEHHTLAKLFGQTLSTLEPVLRERESTLHTYVGYSQGATMGVLMLHEVQTIPRNLLLVEGGYEGWTEKRCRSFQQRGGRRVYFACGTNTCAKQAKIIVDRLNSAGVQARYEWARNAGHTPEGAVGELARAGLAWLLSER